MNPSVSLIICSYNQEDFVKESIEGALSQTFSPIEIIISDDCSTDSTYQVIEEAVKNYSGPNSIILNRNATNLGLIKHVNKVFAMASGDLIIGSAGDDISLPERVETMVNRYKARNGKPTLFHGNVLKIDSKSKVLGTLPPPWGDGKIDLNQTALRDSLYIGASSAFTKNLLDSFPPLHYKNAYEDLVWGFRATLLDAVEFIEKPLVKYRVDVGISWQLHALSAPSPSEILKRDQRKLFMFKDVLAQRLLDLNYVKGRNQCVDTRNALEEKLLETKISYLLLTNKVKSLKYLLLSPRTYLKQLNKLRKKIRQLKKQWKTP